ncbi:MAG: hypothetical protein L0J94_03380, partial [Corynebacterium flavescens]|nr:hypothetical protein [Corynebacterium flavescens]
MTTSPTPSRAADSSPNQRRQVWPGEAYPLGSSFDGSGTNFALFSDVAEKVELCLIDHNGEEERIELTEVHAHVW